MIASVSTYRLLLSGVCIFACSCTSQQKPESLSTLDEPESSAVSIADFESRFDALLKRCVEPRDGFVHYDRLREDRVEMDQLLLALAGDRKFASDAQRKATLINAYNLFAMANVIHRRVTTTARDAPGFFTRDRFDLFGEKVTLDDLRDRKIRPLGDPRVHMALVYAASGAPPLSIEAYSAEKIDAQLDAASRRFVNDTVRNRRLGSLALVSRTFEVFAKDFQVKPYEGARGFIIRYADADSPLGALLKKDADAVMEYQDINWALNSR